ncbi:twin transmembrane helix small protein [Maricaulis alexandrii]|jgi:putative copper export protein|uniref:twin transmembrane helix small protein n=1 Tax=Maricaulis alexandrii TaxID=2570354 RepID=UPI001108EBD6|nr:twin transmembrane helix small protein [Maricaulis alexandrii]
MTLDNALTGFLYIAMLAVVVVLITGIVNLYRGDEKARSRSNKLMRLRVVTQFVAILLLLVILYVRQNFGS